MLASVSATNIVPLIYVTLAQLKISEVLRLLTAGSPAKVATSGWMVIPVLPLIFIKGE